MIGNECCIMITIELSPKVINGKDSVRKKRYYDI